MDRPSILAVDDDPLSGRLLALALGKQYQVHIAENGREALDFMKTAAPDLIVSDLVMPVMDGLDLLASLRNDPCSRGIPFLALTARVEENLEQEVLQRGADLYMAKPFLLDELRASVAGLLHRRPNARVAGDCA